MKTTKKTENKLTEVYEVIKNYIQSKGYPPTLRELMDKIKVL